MEITRGYRNGKKSGARFAMGTGTHAPAISDEDFEGIEDETGEGVAQIVHDLKNPLSSIALEAEVLNELVARGERFDAGRAISRILHNVMFLDRLIYDLLDACTLTNGKFALHRSRRDLREILVNVIDRVVPSTERHRVILEETQPVFAQVDELRIERVIANLLDNALKYTPPSGDIVVRLRGEQRTAQISIVDQGPGLTAGEAAFVFEPYRRAETSVGRPGTGLGLYVSKQIVEAHGGWIGVESVRGSGARFFFALPLA
jgi:signal transduction histidine kinase